MKRLSFVLLLSSGAWAAEPDAALVFVGEPDPSGADEALLRLGRSRGAKVAREALGDLAEEPRARLQKAVEAYARMQLPDARTRLDALESEAAATGGAGLSRGELIELFATRAAVRLAVGADGWDDLLQVAAFSPARPLDPARFPPRVIETERRAAESLATSGKLLLSVKPADAALFVDGLAVGRGTIDAVVPAGRHFLRAERTGFVAAGRSVEVSPNGAAISLTLAPNSTPPAELFLRRAAQLGARRVVGAWTGTRNGSAALELALADVATGQVRARSSLDLGPRLSESALAAALDLLLPPPPSATPRPLYKRAWFWGVVGGVAAAAALSVGLGVGLTGGHVDGFSARVDLRGAR